MYYTRREERDDIYLNKRSFACVLNTPRHIRDRSPYICSSKGHLPVLQTVLSSSVSMVCCKTLTTYVSLVSFTVLPFYLQSLLFTVRVSSLINCSFQFISTIAPKSTQPLIFFWYTILALLIILFHVYNL